MRLFIPLAVLILSVTAFSGISYAQEETKEEKKSTLASMFSSWNEKQKEKLRAASGAFELQKNEDEGDAPQKEYKPVYQARKAQGARSRIFDPVTSWIEQRRAYQQRNLANIEKYNGQRDEHLADHLTIEAKYNNQRDAHLSSSLSLDAQLQNERDQHLANSLDADAKYSEQRQAYLKKYVAAHRKYLELDVEN